MGRWLARGVAVAGIGGALALSGGAAAFAQGSTGATDPLSSLSKQLQDSSASLPELDPTQLTKILEQNSKSLPLQLPPLKLPDLSSLTPKTPLICGVTIGIGPNNSNCPGSGQKKVYVTKTVPPKQVTVTKVVHEPTKVVVQPVNEQQPVAAAPTGKLAYTGFETGPVLAAGVAALIGGTVLTACARPRKRA